VGPTPFPYLTPFSTPYPKMKLCLRMHPHSENPGYACGLAWLKCNCCFAWISTGWDKSCYVVNQRLIYNSSFAICVVYLCFVYCALSVVFVYVCGVLPQSWRNNLTKEYLNWATFKTPVSLEIRNGTFWRMNAFMCHRMMQELPTL